MEWDNRIEPGRSLLCSQPQWTPSILRSHSIISSNLYLLNLPLSSALSYFPGSLAFTPMSANAPGTHVPADDVAD